MIKDSYLPDQRSLIFILWSSIFSNLPMKTLYKKQENHPQISQISQIKKSV